MNYAIAAVIWCATVVGAFFYGGSVGADQEKVKQAKIEEVAKAVEDAAQRGAANAIAKNKPQNNYIKGRVETIVRSDPVYVVCKHSKESMDAVNAAITGAVLPPARETSLLEKHAQ